MEIKHIIIISVFAGALIIHLSAAWARILPVCVKLGNSCLQMFYAGSRAGFDGPGAPGFHASLEAR
jgi:hypothetical protein